MSSRIPENFLLKAQTVLLPQASLPNPLRRFFLPNGISLPNSAHKSVPFLYQFLVLTLPFQEGTPLAQAKEHTPTEVVTTDSSLGTPDCQVFMVAGETLGPSGTRPDRYFEDISADELSANAPTDETNDDKNARRERNRKRNERRRRLRENLPIRNLTEALDQVECWVHTALE
jgi:hypothetical protein